MKTPFNALARQLLQNFERIEFGSLRITTPEGKELIFKGSKPGADATFVLHDWKAVNNALARGDIALGEDYIAGLWDTNSIEALFTVFLSNLHSLGDYAHGNFFQRLGFNVLNRILRRNSKAGSKQNIQAHYDVGNAFYRLWLDDTMTYSSAIFPGRETSLEDAQNAKYARILSRIKGDSVLEIGCGWGGFAEAAANDSRRVTGITISPSQHAFAQQRLGPRADIRLQDYRDTGGVFDSIVSIEMFEAVGEKYWPVYFRRLSNSLKKGGNAVVQTIVMRDDLFDMYRTSSDFIRHYVFPGGMLPSEKRFSDEARAAGLELTDSYRFGHDYARTLREWAARFETRLSDIRGMGYSEAFVRNWRFYLGTCAAAFAVGRTNVLQLELKHA
jgi:cyclopropane-fatty-acyl-phospholipid synthase